MPIPDPTPWKDIITIGLASIGAALGIMNTWNTLSQRRVRLVVRPGFAYPSDGGTPKFSIAVTNFSNFPITVDEIGFAGERGAKRGKRAMVMYPQVIDNKGWPRRLASREAVSVYFDIDEVLGDPTLLVKAYAGTECGEYAYGESEAVKDLRAMSNELAAKRTPS